MTKSSFQTARNEDSRKKNFDGGRTCRMVGSFGIRVSSVPGRHQRNSSSFSGKEAYRPSAGKPLEDNDRRSLKPREGGKDSGGDEDCSLQAASRRLLGAADHRPLGVSSDWNRTAVRSADERIGRRTVHSHEHRPRGPRARPHLRRRHHRLRRRTVGPPLDHHRHVPRRAGARPRPHHGRPLPLVRAGGQPRGPTQGRRAHPHRPVRSPHARRRPAGVRLRARPARHAQVHRQQHGDRRHLGTLAGDPGAAARRPERPARPGLGGVADPPRGRRPVAGGRDQGLEHAPDARGRGAPAPATPPARSIEARRTPRPPSKPSTTR